MPESVSSPKLVININKKSIFWSLILSFVVVIVSVFFGNLFGSFTTASNDPNFTNALKNYDNWWWYPVSIYIIFLCFGLWVKRKLDFTYAQGKLTRTEVVKTIDKWSGIVDGIGTALPLIGAAVILFTVGLGQKSQYLFLEIAIPFEIKSLFILAIAKLFESAFDDLEIQYLNNIEGPKEVESTLNIEIINLPNLETLKEINKVFDNWNTTMEKMKTTEINTVLENIVKIIGRK